MSLRGSRWCMYSLSLLGSWNGDRNSVVYKTKHGSQNGRHEVLVTKLHSLYRTFHMTLHSGTANTLKSMERQAIFGPLETLVRSVRAWYCSELNDSRAPRRRGFFVRWCICALLSAAGVGVYSWLQRALTAVCSSGEPMGWGFEKLLAQPASVRDGCPNIMTTPAFRSVFFSGWFKDTSGRGSESFVHVLCMSPVWLQICVL
jgi:hypothetical protein